MPRLVVAFLLFATLAWAEEPSSKNPAELPVRRVVLYQNRAPSKPLSLGWGFSLCPLVPFVVVFGFRSPDDPIAR